MSITQTTQSSYEITRKIFNSSREMKAYPGLSAGMVCETLGYYEKGDGGGAKYTIEAIGDTVANEMDIIAIGTGNTLIAKYLYEGKPVNVLQFGAINTYTTEKPGYIPYYKSKNGGVIDTRDDQPYIQRAIDYTHDRLISYEEDDVNGDTQHCYKNAINTIIIPEGNYIIKTQIKLPPYMRFYLEGDVQFTSDVKPFRTNDITTYKLEKAGNSTYKFEDLDKKNDTYGGKIPANFPVREEIFVENDFYYGDTKLKLSKSTNKEYNVYKHGTIKICYRFDENNNPINPYKAKVGNRYAVNPYVNNDIFCGPGSLTLNNTTYIANKDNNGDITYTKPYYSCAIEIGSTEENIRYYAEGSHIKGKHLSYENLRFKKLKIRNFHIGMLQHGYSFYSNVISDTEFWDNDIAFQFGLYAEEEDMENGCIIGEKGLECGEMNHFRDCLFTGNKISVNMMLSGCNTYFTECHFDFDNCMFRAAYRATLTVDKCHIEGIGRELAHIYFCEEGSEAETYTRLPITEERVENFRNRAQKDPLDEFVGIMYAKPITKFSGNQVDQYSYVDLNITSSRIVDNENIPFGLFSYYNKGIATDGDGHFRSNLYLNNNTYSLGGDFPTSFLTTTDNGIVQSGFLLSEFPEKKLNSNEVGTEKDAVQNIPVKSYDSSEFGTFFSHLKPRGKHRFLSNRTLENKYPYFQNVTESMSGVNVNIIESNDESNVNHVSVSYIYTNRPDNNVFRAFDNRAGGFAVYGKMISKTEKASDGFVQPKVCISFCDDKIDCVKGDKINAAIVTDRAAYNSKFDVIYNAETGEYSVVNEENKLLVHSIIFEELDENGNVKGTYEYDVPYSLKSSSEIGELYDYTIKNYPSTCACEHHVVNRDTSKVQITAKLCAPLDITDEPGNDVRSYTFRALLVEKNK